MPAASKCKIGALCVEKVPNISYNTLLDLYVLTCSLTAVNMTRTDIGGIHVESEHVISKVLWQGWFFLVLMVLENCFAEYFQDGTLVAYLYRVAQGCLKQL